MAAASTMALARYLGANPQVRNYAKRAGLAVARATLSGIGRSRARRARRGRWYAGKRVGIPPRRQNGGGDVAKIVAQPAAFNVFQSRSGGSQVLSRVEKTTYRIDCESGSGQLYNFAVTPSNAAAFPVGSSIARNFTKFIVNSMTFEYVPRTGTTADGTVYLGWDPRPHKTGDNDFDDANVVSNLPKVATGSVRQGCSLTISVREPKTMIPPPSTTYDPINYYAGHFAMLVQGDNKTDVGVLQIRYNITLIQPQMDNVASSAAIDLSDMTVEDEGRLAAQALGDGDFHVTSHKRLGFLARVTKPVGLATFTITLSDGAVNAIERVSADHSVFFGVFPRVVAPNELVQLSGDMGAGENHLFLFELNRETANVLADIFP